MGAELIPGPREQGMIQTPDITSTGVFAQEGLSGPLSPHMSMYTYTYPSKATKGTSVRAEGGPLELIRGFLGTELVRLGGGHSWLSTYPGSGFSHWSFSARDNSKSETW